MVYDWPNRLQHTLFPTSCRLCRGAGQPGLELCEGCRLELPWLTHACPLCALPLPGEGRPTLCSHCQKSRTHLDGCRALFVYAAPLDQWIQDLKFRHDLAAARLLGRLLADASPPGQDSGIASLLPVPLHRKRLAERGYNQALEIARPLGRLGYDIEVRCCIRARHTDAQSGLSATIRRKNIRGTFTVTQPVEGRRFILIDDVLTTGATLNELARTLKTAGAASVSAWVVARAV
jgi:ComF family protein